MFKHLPETYHGKLTPKNFGHIGHLNGSKMIDNEDVFLSQKEQDKYTMCKLEKNDLIIITEKIDGMNAGVIKKNGMIYPITRKGYDMRTLGTVRVGLKVLGMQWAKWVDENYSCGGITVSDLNNEKK